MTSRIVRIVAALGFSLIAALLLISCTSQSSDGHDDHDRGTADHNANDVAFVTGMIPHHQQAVEMSAMVPGRSQNPQLIALASDVSGAQGPEIETMKVFLVQWTEGADTPEDDGGHSGMPMTGMMDDATMAKLESLKGGQFDTLWLQSMIAHHRGAIEMARAEIANGANADAKGLAQTIATAQEAEITQMNKMLGG